MKLLAGIGRLILSLSLMAFTVAWSLFVLGAYLTTWPLMRMSPRNRRMQSVMMMGVALLSVMRAYGLDKAVEYNQQTED